MIDLSRLKKHLRVDADFTGDDDLIAGYEASAISAFELWTNRTLLPSDGVLPDPVGNAMLATPAIEQGVLMLVGHWYDAREASPEDMPSSTRALWRPHRWVNL
ncbi:head-tail connector protein [Pseudomonas panipatensis]|uniref:head-tail connector protein n=1 Tax=Pseudomonas panipatensis TaxID=428992 RepID=UPI000B7F381A|nr:head-tail connector protein [Pseudomonas panipatensis]